MQINQIIDSQAVVLGQEPTYQEIDETFQKTNAPIISLLYDTKELVGCIYYGDFKKCSEFNFVLGDIIQSPFLYDYYHILETLREFLKVERLYLPVIDEGGYFTGICHLKDVQYNFNRTIGLAEGGSMLVIETTLQNYSLVDVAKIVESNQAKVLNLYLSSHPDSDNLELTLVLNVSEINDIIATFNRFDYKVKYSTSSIERDEFLKERYDSLMHFLDI